MSDVVGAIGAAVDIALSTKVPSVIVLGWLLDASQEINDAVRVPTVSWSDT